MSRLAQARQAVRFAGGLYGERLRMQYFARVRRDPVMRLRLGVGDPYPLYEQIRADGPFHETAWGSLASADHAVCNQVLRSRQFGARPEEPAYDAHHVGERDGGSFLDLNPPDHGRLRRLAAPAFGKRQMDGYRPMIEKRVQQLLDDAELGGEFDLVTAFAAPLPIAVITELLGVPDDDVAAFERYGAAIGSALDGIKGLRHARALMEADRELEQIFRRLFEARRSDPRDDVVSNLVAAEGETIQPGEMVPICTLLLIAGFETTVNLLGNAVLHLLAHRDQWELLVADPGLAPRAIEEVLRYDSPVQRTARHALVDQEVAGREIRRNQFVNVLIGGANRDPRVYADPGRFDITRTPAVEHLAFSSGIHYCLGQPLARLEGAVALRALAERMPRLQPAGPMRRRDATLLRGPARLPVAVG